MHFLLPILFSLLPLTYAQYGPPPNSNPTTTSSSLPASTTSSNPSIHTVLAGSSGFTYTPNTLTAAIGDTLEFHFFAPLHSVASGPFSEPCTPSTNNTGFFSGDISTSSGQNADVFTVVVNDTSPIWFYCVIPTHCQGGMVGVVNAPADGSATLAEYQAAAAKVANSVAPASLQGGVLAPLKAATTSSSSSAAPSPTKNAGVNLGGAGQWVMFGISGLVAGVVEALAG